MSFVEELLASLRSRRLRVAVIGDVLVDEYVQGTVDRVSPEAAVPILLAGEAGLCVPGGAGNVARQFQHHNVDVELFGLLDAKTAALLDKHGIHREGSVWLNQGRNPVKRRFYAGEQMLLRQDLEQVDYGEPMIEDLRQQLVASFAAVAQTFD